MRIFHRVNIKQVITNHTSWRQYSNIVLESERHGCVTPLPMKYVNFVIEVGFQSPNFFIDKIKIIIPTSKCWYKD